MEYAVIDELDGDKPSLALCSLICRAWRRPSQSLLFRSLTLRPSDSAWLSGPKFEELLQFFVDQRTESEPLPGFVRSLAVRGDAQSPSSMWSDDLLRALVACLPNLHTLSLLGVIFPPDVSRCWSPRVPPQIRGLTTPLRTLHKFVASSCAAYHHTLLELLSIFTHIEELRIVGGRWPTSTQTHEALPPQIPSIHTLILDGCGDSCAEALLQFCHQSGHHFRVIHLRPDRCAELYPLAVYLQDMSAAQALVELYLDVTSSNFFGACCFFVRISINIRLITRLSDAIEGSGMCGALALCSSLEHITFKIAISKRVSPFPSGILPPSFIAPVCVALGQLVCLLSMCPQPSLPRLQFITFTATGIRPMEYLGTGPWSLPEWSKFDDAVAGFPTVRRVDVSLRLEGFRDLSQQTEVIGEWLRQVEDEMPRTVQGGLLRLQISGGEFQ